MASVTGCCLLIATILCNYAVASTIRPPVLPLIVRNPYLSVWLGNARVSPWSKWPMFWTGEEIGLGILVSVPDSGTVYPLLGRPHDSLLSSGDGYNVSFCNYLGATFDASTTNLTYELPPPASSLSQQPLTIVLSFLSPITPTSTLRQSIPAGYITIEVFGDFGVDIYLDINGQWASGDRESKVEWDLTHQTLNKDEGFKTWHIRRSTELLLSEIADRAEWGTIHFTAPAYVHHEAGTSGLLRPRFSRTGHLNDTTDRLFRGIMHHEPVFAFSHSFRRDRSEPARSDEVMFTIAQTQDTVVQFAAERGLTMMKPLWASWFSNYTALLEFHYWDHPTAIKLASAYSSQLTKEANRSGSQEYVDYAGLTARQVLGATTFSGTPENPLLFLKEISSNGNFQTVDVIFPAFPFFLYTNPRWLAYLLEPILEYTLSGQYPNKHALHDLGSHFPNATGHPDGNDEYMPVEECGNILIMGLAIVNSFLYRSDASQSGPQFLDPQLSPHSASLALRLRSEDGISFIDDNSDSGLVRARHWLSRSYSLWKQWTGYLVDYSLRPENQLSTDDFAGPLHLQTNLALKGILGIRAMAGIAEIVNKSADAKHYFNISETYIRKWEEYGMSRDRKNAKLSYDWYGSWTTLYNLYADALLCFHLPKSASGRNQKPFVPHDIYKIQSKHYLNVLQRYGLPLDSRHLYTKSDWSFFAAAVTSHKTRTAMLRAATNWLNETSTDRPLTDIYDTEGSGGYSGAYFMARPVVGGHFAYLALGRACRGEAINGLAFLDSEEAVANTDAPAEENIRKEGNEKEEVEKAAGWKEEAKELEWQGQEEL